MKHGTGMALTDKDFETYKSKMNIINNPHERMKKWQ